jgi:type III pantothenate kinase
LILAIDIGNTSSKLAWFEGDLLKRSERVPTHSLTEQVESLDLVGVARVGVASVVPAARDSLVHGLGRRRSNAPFVVSHRMRLPFGMAYRTPETLGNDRLAAAVGAWVLHRKVGQPLVAIDAGTAVTFEVISADGVYLGGTIAPGPSLLRQALHRGTAQLPRVLEEAPESPLGTSTSEAMQSGIMYGFIDSLVGMMRRIEQELGAKPVTIATGGWSPFLAARIQGIDLVDPHLVLRGVVCSLRLNEG